MRLLSCLTRHLGLFVATLLLLLFAPALHAYGALGFTACPDIVLERGSYMETYRASNRMPDTLANLLYDVLKNKARTGDVVSVRGYVLLTSDVPLEVPGITIRGYGWNETIFFTANQIDKDGPKPLGTPGILFTAPGTAEDMQWIDVCKDVNEDGGLCGVNKPFAGKVTLRRMLLNGSSRCDWLFYHWVVPPNGAAPLFELVMEDCELRGCRIGAGLLHFSGNYSSTYTRCKFAMDASGSRSIGDTSSVRYGRLAAIVQRAGACLVDDCDFYSTGWLSPDGKPYSQSVAFAVNCLVPVTDNYSTAGNPSTKFTIHNSRFHTPVMNTAKVAYDVDVIYGQLADAGGNSGTALDGTLKKSEATK